MDLSRAVSPELRGHVLLEVSRCEEQRREREFMSGVGRHGGERRVSNERERKREPYV